MRLAHVVVVCAHPRLALGAADGDACVLFETGMGERDQRHQDVRGRGGEAGAAAPVGRRVSENSGGQQYSHFATAAAPCRRALIVVEVVDAGPAQHTGCGEHPVFAGHDPQGVG